MSMPQLIQLDRQICDTLIGRYIVGNPRLLERETDEGRVKFSLVELPLDDIIGADVAPILADSLRAQVVHMRLHEWQPDDEAHEHVDDIHPGCGTVIVRLDENGPSRLIVDGETVSETKGIGYWLDEGTPHRIMPGSQVRYTLTAWARRASRPVAR